MWEPSDLALFQSNYGNGNAPAGSPVPEPSAATLLILGVMGGVVRRR